MGALSYIRQLSMKLGALFLLAGAITIISIPLASAVSEQHLTVTPATSEFEVEPGESVEGKITVVNQGADSFSVEMSVSPYVVSGETYEPSFQAATRGIDMSQWVTLSSTGTPQLDSTKLLEVPYRVSVPANTPAGSYYAVIFAESTPLGSSGGGITAHNRVGQVIYLTVKGNTTSEGSVRFPKLPAVITSSEETLSLYVQNTGNAYFVSKVAMSVKDVFGNTVFENTQDRFIVPDVERRVDADWGNIAPIGIYKVTRSASLPDGTTKQDESAIIVLMPLYVGGILIAILIIAGLWIAGRKKSKSKRMRLSRK